MNQRHWGPRRSMVAMLVVLNVSVATSLIASAVSIVLPHPATPTQITALVAKSTAISQLPAHLVPPLSQLALDTATNSVLRAPTVCKTVTRACTFGNTHAHKLVVLFGDSHAWMWINAVSPVMIHQGYRLQLLAYPGCPVAKLSIWAAPILSVFTACDKWRAATVQLIKKESPTLVLLSERTAQLFRTATALVSAKQITTGLASTVRALSSGVTKVAIIGDIPTFTHLASPVTCLAIHVTSVQKCATPLNNPDPAWSSHAGAELAAAKISGATFIDPTRWMCHKSRCSEIVGNLAVYFNGSHVSATYAAFVSTVMGLKIAPLIKLG